VSDTTNRHTNPRITVCLDVRHLEMLDVVSRNGEKMSCLLRRLLEEEHERRVRHNALGIPNSGR
jgi:hypothetical protein